jgi:mRNA interferase MazF
MRRGEVWWGSPRLPGGSAKRRPFLVVSTDAFNRNAQYPKVLVVHLTTAVRSAGPYAWEVELPRGAAGLHHRSIAKCAEVYTVFKDELSELVGTLPSTSMREVDDALSVALGL